MSSFSANGKLLLSAEYFIIDGAVGLCLPTKLGQTLHVKDTDEKYCKWESLNADGEIWFACDFDKQLHYIKSTDEPTSTRLMQILKVAHKQVPKVVLENKHFETHLQFPNDWGLGSSSTLISLIAQYFGCNPYRLLAETFGGSGYDIACATAENPILFHRKNVEDFDIHAANFSPPFAENLYFIHLNKKQNSRDGIAHYKRLSLEKRMELVPEFSRLTQAMLTSKTVNDFEAVLTEHENLVASELNLDKAKDLYFPDFPGVVKSLGAWGGDFVLAISPLEKAATRHYFEGKGFTTVLEYGEMVMYET